MCISFDGGYVEAIWDVASWLRGWGSQRRTSSSVQRSRATLHFGGIPSSTCSHLSSLYPPSFPLLPLAESFGCRPCLRTTVAQGGSMSTSLLPPRCSRTIRSGTGAARVGRHNSPSGLMRPIAAGELRRLARLPGISIGAHTENHLWLPRQCDAVRVAEVIASKARSARSADPRLCPSVELMT